MGNSKAKRSASSTHNLFVAIELTEATQKALDRYDQVILDASPRTRLVRGENRHITIAFLGKTPFIAQAEASLLSCSIEPFSILIGGFGVFGKGGSRVLWAGVDKSPALMQCEKTVRSTLQQAGFSLPDRAFSPHITLARGWDRTHAVNLDQLRSSVQAITMPVEALQLWQTDHEDGKTLYRSLALKKLEPS